MKERFRKLAEYFQEDERRYKSTFRWLGGLLIAFILYFIVVIAIRPLMMFEYTFPPEGEGTKGRLKRDFNSYYLLHDSLKNESMQFAGKEAFLLARLEMAGKDTIGLLVDLSDSIVSLNIQGVSIFESRITDYNLSKILMRSDPFLVAKFISWPFKIAEYSSSVPKVPVIVRKAPKDTIEAASLPEPEMLEEKDQYVSFNLKMDRKLSLVFEQDSISVATGKKSRNHYLRQVRQERRNSILKALIWTEPCEYSPEIRIKLKREDALVIFRAIPENADIAVGLMP